MNGCLLTVGQVAARLQLSRSMIYSMIETGRLSCVRFNSAIRFREADIDALITACATPARENVA